MLQHLHNRVGQGHGVARRRGPAHPCQLGRHAHARQRAGHRRRAAQGGLNLHQAKRFGVVDAGQRVHIAAGEKHGHLLGIQRAHIGIAVAERRDLLLQPLEVGRLANGLFGPGVQQAHTRESGLDAWQCLQQVFHALFSRQAAGDANHRPAAIQVILGAEGGQRRGIRHGHFHRRWNDLDLVQIFRQIAGMPGKVIRVRQDDI